jgi:hypothetical protein
MARTNRVQSIPSAARRIPRRCGPELSYRWRDRALLLLHPSAFQYAVQRLVKPYRVQVEILSLKESAEERRGFIRDAGNLVRCLTIEFEIELGLGSTIVPVEKKFELAPPQAPLRERGASDGNAHARRLPGDPAFLWDRFGRGDDAARDETWPAFVLAREDENRIAFGDVLAAIHRLLRAERERLRQRIANLGFDREHHIPHLASIISMAVHGARPNETELSHGSERRAKLNASLRRR